MTKNQVEPKTTKPTTRRGSKTIMKKKKPVPVITILKEELAPQVEMEKMEDIDSTDPKDGTYSLETINKSPGGEKKGRKDQVKAAVAKHRAGKKAALAEKEVRQNAKGEDLIIYRQKQFLEAGNADADTIQVCQEVLKLGWASLDPQQQAEKRRLLIKDQAQVDFIEWTKNPTAPKSQLLLDLQPQELFIAIVQAMSKDVDWANSVESLISLQMMEILKFPQVGHLLDDYMQPKVIRIIKKYCTQTLKTTNTVPQSLLTVALRHNFAVFVLQEMKARWDFNADHIRLSGDSYKPIQGVHHDNPSFVYVDSIATEFPGLHTDVIKLAIEQPKLLLHRGVLTAFRFTYQALQKTMVALYKNVIQAEEDHGFECDVISKVGMHNELVLVRLSEHQGGKLWPNEISALLLRIQHEDISFWEETLKTNGIVHLFRNVDTLLKQKSRTDFNHVNIQAFYEQVSKKSAVQDKLMEVEAVFKEMANKGFYKTNPYQTAVSAELFSCEAKVVSGEVASGDGKTFMQIGIANSHKDSTEVVIAVVNEMLEEQVQAYVNQFSDHQRVKVLLTTELTYSKVKDKILICDEYDHMIDQQCVQFGLVKGKYQVKGLINAYYAKKVYLLSATLEPFHRLFCQILLGLKIEHMYQYKSMFELTDPSGRGREAHIEKKLTRSKAQTVEQLKKEIDHHVTERPIIVFTEKGESDYDAMLKATAVDEQGVSWHVVSDKKKANEVRNIMSLRPRGVIRVCREYARGYDLKLTQDAHVIIVANGHEMKLTEVMQMIGRGCRSQGKPKGTVIIESDLYNDSSEAWDAISTRRTDANANCAENLGKLAQAIPYADHVTLEKVKKIYEGNLWHARPTDFSNSNHKLIKELTKAISKGSVRDFNTESNIQE